MPVTVIEFDTELDEQLAEALPPVYRGARKTRLRAETAAREWLRSQTSNDPARPNASKGQAGAALQRDSGEVAGDGQEAGDRSPTTPSQTT